MCWMNVMCEILRFAWCWHFITLNSKQIHNLHRTNPDEDLSDVSIKQNYNNSSNKCFQREII